MCTVYTASWNLHSETLELCESHKHMTIRTSHGHHKDITRTTTQSSPRSFDSLDQLCMHSTVPLYGFLMTMSHSLSWELPYKRWWWPCIVFLRPTSGMFLGPCQLHGILRKSHLREVQSPMPYMAHFFENPVARHRTFRQVLLPLPARHDPRGCQTHPIGRNRQYGMPWFFHLGSNKLANTKARALHHPHLRSVDVTSRAIK